MYGAIPGRIIRQVAREVEKDEETERVHQERVLLNKLLILPRLDYCTVVTAWRHFALDSQQDA